MGSIEWLKGGTDIPISFPSILAVHKFVRADCVLFNRSILLDNYIVVVLAYQACIRVAANHRGSETTEQTAPYFMMFAAENYFD